MYLYLFNQWVYLSLSLSLPTTPPPPLSLSISPITPLSLSFTYTTPFFLFYIYQPPLSLSYPLASMSFSLSIPLSRSHLINNDWLYLIISSLHLLTFESKHNQRIEILRKYVVVTIHWRLSVVYILLSDCVQNMYWRVLNVYDFKQHSTKHSTSAWRHNGSTTTIETTWAPEI